MSSRLPQRKVAPKQSSYPEAKDILALFESLGLEGISLEDFERLCQGRLHELLSFLSAHLLGRSAVSRIRSDIWQLQSQNLSSPVNSKIFPSSTAITDHSRTLSSLSRSKKDLDSKQETINKHQTELLKLHDKSQQCWQNLSEARTTAFLLKILQSRESDRVFALAELQKRLKSMEKNPVSNPQNVTTTLLTDVESSITVALGQPSSISTEQRAKLKQQIQNAITETAPTEIIDRLLLQLKAVQSKMSIEAQKGYAPRQPKLQAVADSLTSLQLRHVQLSSPQRPPRSILEAEEAITAALARSMKVSPMDPRLLKARDKLLASSRLRASQAVLGPGFNSPEKGISNKELDEACIKIKRMREQTQTLLNSFNIHLESCNKLSQEVVSIVQNELWPSRPGLKRAESSLTGYVDARRRQVSSHSQGNPEQEEEFALKRKVRSVLKVSPGTSEAALLQRISDMVADTHLRIPLILKANELETPNLIANDRLPQILMERHTASEQALNQLGRKADKAQAAKILIAETEKIFAEREIITSGRLHVTTKK